MWGGYLGARNPSLRNLRESRYRPWVAMNDAIGENSHKPLDSYAVVDYNARVHTGDRGQVSRKKQLYQGNRRDSWPHEA